MSALSVESLVGTWELVDFHVTSSDGRAKRYPFGQEATGRILYAADGHMMAVLSRGAVERKTGQLSSLETSHRAGADDKAAAFDSYLSYSGRWRLSDGQVHHEVDLALVPGVVGQIQSRVAVMHDGLLTLSYTRQSRRGIVHTFTLRWTRPGAPA